VVVVVDHNKKTHDASHTPPTTTNSPEPFGHLMTPSLGVFSLQDMNLFRTFITKTAMTLSEDPAVGHVMSTAVVDIALKNEFVLHMILCLAALHRCATESFNSTEEVLSLLEASTDHQNLSMALFRQSVSAVTPENAEAVFIYTSLTSMSLYSSQNERLRLLNELEAGEKGRLSESGWLRTLRGTTALLGGGGDLSSWLGEGSPLLILIPYRGHFQPGLPEENDWAQAAANAFTKLADIFTAGGAVYQPVFHEATRYLVLCLAQMTVAQNTLNSGCTIISGDHDSTSRISARPTSYCLTWIFRISAAFLDFLDDNEPAAFVILAHFGVLLHSLPPEWCLGGMGKAVAEACDERLRASGNDSWRVWMEWPFETIRRLDEERSGLHN